jgi:hypothetical protein
MSFDEIFSRRRERRSNEASAVTNLRKGARFYLNRPDEDSVEYTYQGDHGAVRMSYEGTVGDYDKMRIQKVEGDTTYQDQAGRRYYSLGRGIVIFIRNYINSRWQDKF